MTAQPAPSRIDTYDFAFRTTPDSHLYWQSTLCSIFTDRLIPCLGFKILVKRSTMPFLAARSRNSLETIIDSKCSILFRSVPGIKRYRHPNQWRNQKSIYEKVFSSRTSGKNSGKNTKTKNWRAPIGQAVEPEGYQDWTQPRFPTLFLL